MTRAFLSAATRVLLLAVLVPGSGVATEIRSFSSNHPRHARSSSRLGLDLQITPTPAIRRVHDSSDVFIASSTNGGEFTDLSPVYETALLAAGASSVSIITDRPDEPFGFPSPFTAAEYGVVVVLTNDNWFGATGGQPEANVSLADEVVLAAYLDSGGAMLFSGQDYLFARGGTIGFPQLYLGLLGHFDDINFGDIDLDYTGTGGPLLGMTGHLHAEPGAPVGPCYATNAFYSDDVVPITGVAENFFDYTSLPSTVAGQGGAVFDAGTFKSLFTVVDFACTDDTAQFQRDLTAIYGWLADGATAVEPGTWGEVKRRYE